MISVKPHVLLLLLFFSCSGKNDYTIILEHLQPAGNFSELTGEGKYAVYVFYSPECPLSENYTLVMNRIYHKYSTGFNFHGIIPGNYFDEGEVMAFAQKFKIEFPLYIDKNFKLAKYFDATITPEVFVSDSTGKVYYSGAIDNWAFSLGRKRQVVTEHYLDNALKAIASGIPAVPAKTKAIGCFIEY